MRCVAMMLLLSLVGCAAPDSPEEEIRALFEKMAEAAEAADYGDFADGIADDYADLDGRDQDEVLAVVRRVFLVTRSLTVLTDVQSIEVVTDSFATATVKAWIADVDIRRLQFDGDGITFELELVHEGGAWRVSSANWDPKYEPL